MTHKRDYQNYEVVEVLNDKHFDTIGYGRENHTKATEKSFFSCHWTPYCVLSDIFKGLNNHLTGETDQPWNEARRMVINGEEWSREELTATFDMKRAKDAARKIKKRLGLSEQFIVPKKYHHLKGGEQVHFPIMETNSDGIMIENRRNLFFVVINYLQLLLMATNLVLDCTYRNLKGSFYLQTLNVTVRTTINGIDKYVTVCSIIMTGKHKNDYKAVFRELFNNPQFLAGRSLQYLQTVTTDFEVAITGMFLEEFRVPTSCEVCYCSVHFTRNVQAKARSKGIVSQFTSSNGKFSEFYRDIEQVSQTLLCLFTQLFFFR